MVENPPKGEIVLRYLRRLIPLLVACLLLIGVTGAVKTIVEPSAADQMVSLFNGPKMGQGRLIPISGEQRWVTVYIPLGAGVVQPDDYAALQKAVDAIPGLGVPVLLVDRRKTTTVPEGYRLMLSATAQMRLYKIPEPPPEP